MGIGGWNGMGTYGGGRAGEEDFFFFFFFLSFLGSVIAYVAAFLLSCSLPPLVVLWLCCVLCVLYAVCVCAICVCALRVCCFVVIPRC